MPKPPGKTRDDSSDSDMGRAGSDESTLTQGRGTPHVIDAVKRFFSSTPESSKLPQASAPTAPAAITSGTELPRPWGRYELRRRLGRGSFGEVFCAWDPELEWEIAIKILHDERDLLPEARALAQFKDCENIVKVLSVEKHEGRVGLCMELIDGEPLDQLVRDFGSFSASEATGVAVAVASAAGAIHRRHFIHRDIKAQNVMRARGGRIVLMDFGAGRWVDGLSATDSVGTALYMAPELLEGALPSFSSDIYSIGVLLFYLVTGKYPVQGKSMEGLKMAHRAGRRRLLGDERPDLSQRFIRIVDRAIAPDPNARYQSVAPLLRDLAELDPHNLRRTPAQWLAIGAGVTLAGVLATGFFGFITSRHFNEVFQRANVASENLGDYLDAGRQTLPLPLAAFTLVVIVILAIAGIGRYARQLQPSLDRRLQQWSAALQRAHHRLGLDHPCNFAQFTFLVALCYTTLHLLFYHALFAAILKTVSEMTPEQRALLAESPATDLAKRNFTTFLNYPVAGLAWGLYRFSRLRQIHPKDGGVSYAVGMAALLLACIVLIVAPYRLFFKAQFPPVRYLGQECFDLGSDRGMTYKLVYCPDAVSSQPIEVLVNNPKLEVISGAAPRNPFKP